MLKLTMIVAYFCFTLQGAGVKKDREEIDLFGLITS